MREIQWVGSKGNQDTWLLSEGLDSQLRDDFNSIILFRRSEASLIYSNGRKTPQTVSLSPRCLTSPINSFLLFTLKNLNSEISFSLQVISQNAVLSGDMKKTCDVLGVDPSSLTTLQDYLESFFNTILSKVQKIKKSEYVSQTARDLEI